MWTHFWALHLIYQSILEYHMVFDKETKAIITWIKDVLLNQ